MSNIIQSEVVSSALQESNSGMSIDIIIDESNGEGGEEFADTSLYINKNNTLKNSQKTHVKTVSIDANYDPSIFTVSAPISSNNTDFYNKLGGKIYKPPSYLARKYTKFKDLKDLEELEDLEGLEEIALDKEIEVDEDLQAEENNKKIERDKKINNNKKEKYMGNISKIKSNFMQYKERASNIISSINTFDALNPIFKETQDHANSYGDFYKEKCQELDEEMQVLDSLYNKIQGQLSRAALDESNLAYGSLRGKELNRLSELKDEIEQYNAGIVTAIDQFQAVKTNIDLVKDKFIYSYLNDAWESSIFEDGAEEGVISAKTQNFNNINLRDDLKSIPSRQVFYLANKESVSFTQEIIKKEGEEEEEKIMRATLHAKVPEESDNRNDLIKGMVMQAVIIRMQNKELDTKPFIVRGNDEETNKLTALMLFTAGEICGKSWVVKLGLETVDDQDVTQLCVDLKFDSFSAFMESDYVTDIKAYAEAKVANAACVTKNADIINELIKSQNEPSQSETGSQHLLFQNYKKQHNQQINESDNEAAQQNTGLVKGNHQ